MEEVVVEEVVEGDLHVAVAALAVSHRLAQLHRCTC